MPKPRLALPLLVAICFTVVTSLEQDGIQVFGDVQETDDLDLLLQSEDLIRVKPVKKGSAVQGQPRSRTKRSVPSHNEHVTSQNGPRDIDGPIKSTQGEGGNRVGKLSTNEVQSAKENVHNFNSGGEQEETFKTSTRSQSSGEKNTAKSAQMKEMPRSLKDTRTVNVDSEKFRIINDNFTLHAEKLRHKLEELNEKIHKLRNKSNHVQRLPGSSDKTSDNFHVIQSSKEVSDFHSDVQRLKDKFVGLNKKLEPLRALSQSHRASRGRSQEVEYPVFSEHFSVGNLEKLLQEVDSLKEMLFTLDQRIHKFLAFFHVQAQSKLRASHSKSSSENDNLIHNGALYVETEALKQKLLELEEKIGKLKGNTVLKSKSPPSDNVSQASVHILSSSVDPQIHEKAIESFKWEANRLKKKLEVLDGSITRLRQSAHLDNDSDVEGEFPESVPKSKTERNNAKANEGSMPPSNPSSRSLNKKMERDNNVQSAKTGDTNLVKEFLSEVGLLMQQLHTLDEQILSVKARSHLLSTQHELPQLQTVKPQKFSPSRESSDSQNRLRQEAALTRELDPEETSSLETSSVDSSSAVSEKTFREGKEVASRERSHGVPVKDVQTCLDGQDDSIACVMYLNQLLPVKKGDDLSLWNQKTEPLVRKRRQSDGSENGNNENADEGDEDCPEGRDDCGSGQAGDLYVDEEDVPKSFKIPGTLEFSNSSGLSEDEIRKQVTDQVNEAFRKVGGNTTTQVTSVSVDPDGTVRVTYEATVTDTGSGDPGPLFGTTTQTTFEDELTRVLNTTVAPKIDNIKIGGSSNQIPMDIPNAVNSASTDLSNPCTRPCNPGYHNCVVRAFGDAYCTHKCVSYTAVQGCEHGGTCELGVDFEPSCSCGKNWKGPYCESRRNELSDAEITGVATGAVVAAAGLCGVVVWFIFFRSKGQPPLDYTDYADDVGGSDSHSNPSSKLTSFAIDRPQFSPSPINLFQPSPPASASGGGQPPPDRFSRV